MKVQARESKYCTLIRQAVKSLGHASNAEIAVLVRKHYPYVSDTTIHRATARLAGRGEISVAPADTSGAMRYDANIKPHDHFLCTECDELQDIDVLPLVMNTLENCTARNCQISGRVLVSGICGRCSRRT
ncbi:transcriptional repressor [Candidatus Saccharibacteria bacterium]|nr:transcriptional repressor [Candidatus Saccharibacteria bacterium]MCB9821075.1 transcriptional repressor [Candidatus Nomurabacteria bacterium]